LNTKNISKVLSKKELFVKKRMALVANVILILSFCGCFFNLLD